MTAEPGDLQAQVDSLTAMMERMETQHVTFRGPSGEEYHPDWCRECRVDKVRAEAEKFKAAILDIDAHATPIGLLHNDDPEGSPHHYAVTVGALHRALGKVGHTAANCDMERERLAAEVARLTEGSELATYRQALVDALQVNGHLRGVMHKRLGLPLTFTPDQLDEALGKLTEIVERLTAGADPSPPTEGVWLSPAQWIHRWNQLSAEQRLVRAQHVIDNAQAATHCLISGHDARLTWLEMRASAAARYERALAAHDMLPDEPEFREAVGLGADGSLPGRRYSLEEVAAEFDVDLDDLGDEVAAEHYWEHRDDPVDPADVETVKVERPKLATAPPREHGPAMVALHDCKGDASCCGICVACQKGDCDSCNGCDGCPEGTDACDAPVGDGELMCGDYAAHGSNRCSVHTKVAGGAA